MCSISYKRSIVLCLCFLLLNFRFFNSNFRYFNHIAKQYLPKSKKVLPKSKKKVEVVKRSPRGFHPKRDNSYPAVSATINNGKKNVKKHSKKQGVEISPAKTTARCDAVNTCVGIGCWVLQNHVLVDTVYSLRSLKIRTIEFLR